MREIKFRLLLCNMVVGYEVHRKGEALYVSVMHSPSGEDWKNIQYFEPILHDDKVRFTGLRDKNGKEIYEGDIVKSHFNWKSYPVVFGSCELRDSTGEFEGFFDGLAWDGTPFGRDAYGGTDHYEVIGNVYENPELLGV